MLPIERLFFVGIASLVAACAASRLPVPAAPHEQTPATRADPVVIDQIAEIDREMQAQREQVDELSTRVAAIHAELAQAVQRGDEPGAQASSNRDVTAEPGQVRVRLSEEVLFATASARITRRGRRLLTRLAETLRGPNVARVEIAGHTDSVPITHKYGDNWELSLERARRVALYLITQSVDARKLRLVGYGDCQPLVAGKSSEARARNRRVELFVIPPVVATRDTLRR